MNYYLNRIYFGKGYFGVGAAARGYFNKEAINLTVPECALLAGIIRAPTSSSPRTDLGKAKWRRDATLKQMLRRRLHQASHEEYSHYLNTPIRIQPAKPNGLQSFVMAAAVKEMEQILSIEGTEEMPQGLTVRTNINLRLQRAIEEQMNLSRASTSSPLPRSRDRNPASPPLNPKWHPKTPATATASKPAAPGCRHRRRCRHRPRPRLGRRPRLHQEPVRSRLHGPPRKRRAPPAAHLCPRLRPPQSPALLDDQCLLHRPRRARLHAADLALGNPLVDLNRRFLSIQDALALGSKPAATRVGLSSAPSPSPAGSSRPASKMPASPDDNDPATSSIPIP